MGVLLLLRPLHVMRRDDTFVNTDQYELVVVAVILVVTMVVLVLFDNCDFVSDVTVDRFVMVLFLKSDLLLLLLTMKTKKKKIFSNSDLLFVVVVDYRNREAIYRYNLVLLIDFENVSVLMLITESVKQVRLLEYQ